MSHTVIVAGGTCDLSEYEDILKDAYLIGADRGALCLAESGYVIDVSVGDFDSVTKEELEKICEASKEVEELYAEKDDTDLEHAVNRAISTTAGTVYILGATGTRLDQTLSAIYLLKTLYDAGREAYICDKNNRIRIAKGHTSLYKSSYRYVSLIPYGDSGTVVSLRGFKYSGEHIALEKSSSLGISNEIVGESAEISCSDHLFVFESND